MSLVYKYTQCSFDFDGSRIDIPDNLRVQINENWNMEILSGKKYENGDIFTVNNIFVDSDNIVHFIVKQSNFAHYLFSRKREVNKHTCRSIAANALIITNDNFIVLGVMNKGTSLANKIKFIGGSMSKEDCVNERIIPSSYIIREVKEEVGIDIEECSNACSITPRFFLTREKLSFINVLFEVEIDMSAEQLNEKFILHQKRIIDNNLECELDSLIFIKNSFTNLEKFMNENRKWLIDYMEDFFYTYYEKCDSGNLLEEI